MSAIIAAIISMAKAVPAAEQFLAMLMEAYTVYKKNQNAQNEADKNARDDAAIDAAIGGLPKCPTCGAPLFIGGQHGAAPKAPAVSSGGSSGS